MYANRYDASRTSRPVSFGAALLINGALVAGLWFASPQIIKTADPGALITEAIPFDPPPPIQPEVKRKPDTVKPPSSIQIHQLDPRVITPPTGPVLGTTRDPAIPIFDPPVGPVGPGSVRVDPPVAPPVLTGAEIDPRYAGAFQPDYPGLELRQAREGVVKVRVLIGVDGRIKAVEQVATPTPGLFEATRRHALNKWRFKPATRDGIPVEGWKVMTVRFQITS